VLLALTTHVASANTVIRARVHEFGDCRNVGASWKVWAPEGWHEACLYWGSTNVRHHCMKVSCHTGLAPGICELLD